jgi:teichuronic acid biosynthesis glycosyltransferase TuaG
MMEASLISIITATYNSEGFIRETYNSLVNQTYSNWEWLVTDDASSDNTISILKEISLNDSRVQVSQNSKNMGAAISRNKSIELAKGKFLAFIDSDDLWKSDKLEKQVEFMGNGFDFSFTSYMLIDGKGEPLGKYVDIAPIQSVGYFDMLRKRCTIGCSTVMLRTKAFPNLKMPLIRTGQDYATWLKILKTGKRAYLVNSILTEYRITPNSISRNKFKKAFRQWYIYRKIEQLPLNHSIISFCFYAWRAVFRN